MTLKQNLKKYIVWPLVAWLYIFVCLQLLPHIGNKILENILFYSIPFVLFIFVCIGYIKTVTESEIENKISFYVKHIIIMMLISALNILIYLISGYLILKLLASFNIVNISTSIELYTIIFLVVYILSIIGLKIRFDKKWNQIGNILVFSCNFIILISLIFIAVIYTRFW